MDFSSSSMRDFRLEPVNFYYQKEPEKQEDALLMRLVISRMPRHRFKVISE